MAEQQPVSDAVKQIHFLAAALKAPRIVDAAVRLADQARDAGWSHRDDAVELVQLDIDFDLDW
jgi:hypothetical protein